MLPRECRVPPTMKPSQPPQQLWKHLTPQRMELPLHPSVNVTRPWMCEQWHQWSHLGHSRPPLRTILPWSRCQGWRGSGAAEGGNGALDSQRLLWELCREPVSDQKSNLVWRGGRLGPAARTRTTVRTSGWSGDTRILEEWRILW